MSVILVMYHYVRDVETTPYPGIAAISTEGFAGQVAHLLRHHEPVRPGDVLASVRTGRPLPENGFLLTFDDGVRDHWDAVLPVMERHGLHGIFAPIALPYTDRAVPFTQKNQFVRAHFGQDRLPTVYVETAERLAPGADVAGMVASTPEIAQGAGSETYRRFKYAVNRVIPFEISRKVVDHLFEETIGRDERAFVDALYLSQHEIRELSRMGHAIAGHSMTHRSLPGLSTRDLEREIRDSLAWLGAVLGRPPCWFNYPYGDCDDRCEAVVRDLGVDVAYSTRPPVPWTDPSDRHRAPRVDTCLLPEEPDGPVSEPSRLLLAGHATGRT
jgi:peptidoglycan/xylan/chitin deacetylase (PgdA/CDA1 family)